LRFPLAVIAHIRHAYTDYDTLLCKWRDRHETREVAYEKVQSLLAEWRAALESGA